MPSERVRYDSPSTLDGDTAVHSRNDAVVDAAADIPFEAVSCPLAELCLFDNIWESICYWMSASQVSKMFRIATRKSPAFVLLAGINNDANVVPWGSPANVMSSKYIHLNCNLVDEIGREVVAIKTAESMLQNVAHPEYLRRTRVRLHRLYVCSGPARPPSPEVTAKHPKSDGEQTAAASEWQARGLPHIHLCVWCPGKVFVCPVLACVDW